MPTQHQSELKEGLSGLAVSTDDHTVLGSYSQTDQLGGLISNIMVTDIIDERVCSDLIASGLKPDDAKHLMYAAHQGYDRFLTCDGGILNRRAAIKRLCPALKVQRPSELIAELPSVNTV